MIFYPFKSSVTNWRTGAIVTHLRNQSEVFWCLNLGALLRVPVGINNETKEKVYRVVRIVGNLHLIQKLKNTTEHTNLGKI